LKVLELVTESVEYVILMTHALYIAAVSKCGNVSTVSVLVTFLIGSDFVKLPDLHI